MRKKFKTILLCCLYLAIAFLVIKSIILLFQAKDVFIAYITNDYETTNATVSSINEDGSINISYFVNDTQINTSVKYFDYYAYGREKEISIDYCKSHPNKVLTYDSMLFGDLFLLFILVSLTHVSPFFAEITNKYRTKSSELILCDFVSAQSEGEYWYSVTYSYEKDGKKEVESVLCGSKLIEALINNNILDKVPIRIYKNKKRLDLEYIKEKVEINESWVQLN